MHAAVTLPRWGGSGIATDQNPLDAQLVACGPCLAVDPVAVGESLVEVGAAPAAARGEYGEGPEAVDLVAAGRLLDWHRAGSEVARRFVDGRGGICMELGIGGRCAVVLAGGGGLGSAAALALSQEGAEVAVADISKERADASAEVIAHYGGRARGYACDTGSMDSVEALAARVRADLGAPSILVNITGGPPAYGAMEVPLGVWSGQFERQVLGVIHLTRLLLPDMRRNTWGRVITSTSSGVVAPIPNLVLSNALRLTLVGWSKSLASEVARDGVTVNVVVPGRISTARVRELDEDRARREGRKVEEVQAASCAAIPVGRYGMPSEFGSVITFLASDAASYVTGGMVRVDGGMIASI